MSNNISVVIHTRNEIDNIQECIESVKSIADEVIVIDMQSSDRTVAEAEEMGAIVYKHPNVGIVEPARNFGIKKAKNEWILVIDADERISTTLKTKLLSLTKQEKFDVFLIPRKNIIFNKWLKSSKMWPDFQIRFFRKGTINWPPFLDSVPEYNKDKAKFLPVSEKYAIAHYNHRNLSKLIEKIDRYTDNSHIEEITDRDIVERMLIYPTLEFNRRYYEHQGQKDGIESYVFTKCMEFYEFLKWAKHWERRKNKFIYSNQELQKRIFEVESEKLNKKQLVYLLTRLSLKDKLKILFIRSL